jgi:YD repeat-containing protein
MQAGSATWTWIYGTDTVMITPSGARTTYHYDPSTFNLTSRDNPEGFTTTLIYNVNRLKIMEQIPAGTIYSVVYDPTLWLITSSSDALNNQTTMQYDPFGNLTTYIDANAATTTFGYAGTGSTHLRIRQTDALGRVTSYAYTSDGLLQSTTTPRGLTTTMSYDIYGNVVSMMASDGSISTFGYDSLNRQISATDPLNRTTTTVYDAADNRIASIEPTGAITTFIFTTCLLQAVVNPLNQRTSWTYGRYSNRLTEVNALNQVTSWNYDNQGFVLSTQDALGNFSTVIYNAARQSGKSRSK